MENKEPMTEYGYKKIQEEFEALKAERPKVVEEIERAKEHGDLRENAEYHACLLYTSPSPRD